MSLLAQLDPFSAKDGSLPQSSRMDLSMEQRVGRPFLLGWGVGDVCKLGWIVANKGASVCLVSPEGRRCLWRAARRE